MREYPSIPGSMGTSFREIPNASIFDKLDGSSCRSEWSRKRGWYKHGRRDGLLDDSNPHLKQVGLLFSLIMDEPLTRIARDNHWDSMVAFYEFWGKKSLAGNHVEDDPKFLSLFDVVVNKQGFLEPHQFWRTFWHEVPTATYLGQYNWTRGFVERVRGGDLPGVTFEGVVGKASIRHDIVRSKAKTQAWIDAVRRTHGASADSIING